MSNETTSEARARLDLAARSPLVRPRDRWLYGGFTATVGPVFGLYSAFGSSTAVTVAFFVVMGLVVWGLSLLPTVPRHARAVGNGAMVGGLVLFLVGLAVLNVDDSAWLRAVVAVAVAAPLLVGGALIARGPR